MAPSIHLSGSRYSKIGLIVLGLGTIFQVIGYAVPDWQTADTSVGVATKGLWVECGHVTSGCVYITGASDWLRAVQVLETVAVVFLACSWGCVAWYLCRGTKTPALSTAVLSITAGVVALIGSIIYWSKHHDSGGLYYGFAFVVIGPLNCISAGAIFVYEAVKHANYVKIT